MVKIEILNRIQWLYKKCFSNPAISIIGGFGVVLLIISLFNRYIYIDDVFFGEQSYYLATDGIVKIPSMVGFMGCDEHLFSYHKLHVFIGAGLIKIFGFTLNPLRIISLLFFVLLEFLLLRFGLFKRYDKQIILFSMFYLFFNPLILLFAFTFRPEIWVTLAGFTSYFFLNKYSDNKTVKDLLLSGIFAGLAFLLHLNGLIFPVAGFIYILIRRQFRGALIFGVSSGFISLFYFWDLWQPGHLETWLYQLKHWPDNNITNYSSFSIAALLKNIFVKLLSEHQRFFWSYKVWGTSLIFLLALIADFNTIKSQHRGLLLYFLLLLITLNIAGSQIAERYLIYLLPYMAIITAIGVKNLFNTNKSVFKSILIVALVCQVVFVVQMSVDIYKRNNNYVDIHQELLSKIPDTRERILVPYQFLFNGIEEYNLVSFKAFEYYEVQNQMKFNYQSFFTRAGELNIKYIVLPKQKLKQESTALECFGSFNYDNLVSNNYKEFFEDDYAIILKAAN